MNLQELKADLKNIAENYILEANKSKKSAFYILKYFSTPYKNLDFAKNLTEICDGNSNRIEFIDALSNLFSNIEESQNFIPAVVGQIILSKLFPSGSEMYDIIEAKISENNANENNMQTSWETKDYLSVIQAARSGPFKLEPITVKLN